VAPQDQNLLQIIEQTQRNLTSLWKRRQEIIALNAGDTFVMNQPSLPELCGTVGGSGEEGELIDGFDSPDFASVAHKAPASSGSRKDQQQQQQKSRKRSTSTSDKDRKHRKSDKVKRAVQSPPPPGTKSGHNRPSITATLRTACLKPVKAGLARQVDKMMVERVGVPLRPVYPSERNCDMYDRIRALLAERLEAGL
jgi:hypothetical protein